MNGQLDPIALMRKIGELEGKIEALRTIQTGGQWIPARIPVYVSTTSVRFVGINLTSVFPVGTKIKCTQTTVKYFYVIAAAYSGGDTTLTLTGGSDYTVANAAITEFHYSHAAVADGFPSYFNWTPSFSGSGSMTISSLSLTIATFTLNGSLLNTTLRATFTTGGTASNSVIFNLPLPASNIYHMFSALRVDGGSGLSGLSFVLATDVSKTQVRPWDSTNWGLGTGRQIYFTGTYTI